MGEIAELMLDGTLCESCGVYLGATDMDCPCLCGDCALDRQILGHAVEKIGRIWIDVGTILTVKKAKKLRCPTCAKMVKPLGMADHTRVVHGMAAHKEPELSDAAKRAGRLLDGVEHNGFPEAT